MRDYEGDYDDEAAAIDPGTVAIGVTSFALLATGWICLATFVIRELWGFVGPLLDWPPLPGRTALAIALLCFGVARGCGVGPQASFRATDSNQEVNS